MAVKRTKLWSSISVATLAGVAGLSACSSLGEGEGGEGEAAMISEAKERAGYNSHLAHSEGEGEGEGNDVADLSSNDLAYLTQLSLIRGHLYVGYKLYKSGHIDHAKTHSKHPKSELYAAIEPVFSVRGLDGFATELSVFSNALERELSSKTVDLAYQALSESISKHEAQVSEKAKTPAEQLKLVAALLRVAGEEYAIAVVDGKMQNAHEYQDALGFTMIAKTVVQQIEEADDQKKQALTLLDDLMPLWPGLVPPDTLSTEAGQLYGAAAKVDLLALSL